MNKKILSLFSLACIGVLSACGNQTSSVVSSSSEASSATSSNISSSAVSSTKAELAKQVFNAYQNGEVKIPTGKGMSFKEQGSFKFDGTSDGKANAKADLTTSSSGSFTKNASSSYDLGLISDLQGTASVNPDGQTETAYSIKENIKGEVSDKVYFADDGEIKKDNVVQADESGLKYAYATQNVSDFMKALGLTTVSDTALPALNLNETQIQDVYDFLDGKSDNTLSGLLNYHCGYYEEGKIEFVLAIKSLAFAEATTLVTPTFLNNLIQSALTLVGNYLPAEAKDYLTTLSSLNIDEANLNIPSTASVKLGVRFDENYLPLICKTEFNLSDSTLNGSASVNASTSSSSAETQKASINLSLKTFELSDAFAIAYDSSSAITLDAATKATILEKGTDISDSIKSGLNLITALIEDSKDPSFTDPFSSSSIN
ncbi:MAG: hypothetical protein LKJ88_02700 [Bacilli bacterium]|jgi:hypothetical protein|nr:hypothetical protein [Bacilli bacterium]